MDIQQWCSGTWHSLTNKRLSLGIYVRLQGCMSPRFGHSVPPRLGKNPISWWENIYTCTYICPSDLKINTFKGTILLMIFDLQGIHEVTDASQLREEVIIANKCYLETLIPIRQRFRTISSLIMCFFTCKFEPLLSPTIFVSSKQKRKIKTKNKFMLLPLPHLFIFWFPPGFFSTKKNDKFPKGCSPSHRRPPPPGFKKLPKASLKEAKTARCAGKRCSSF